MKKVLFWVWSAGGYPPPSSGVRNSGTEKQDVDSICNGFDVFWGIWSSLRILIDPDVNLDRGSIVSGLELVVACASEAAFVVFDNGNARNMHLVSFPSQIDVCATKEALQS